MATLSRDTIRRLAVLRALSRWSRGAYGQLRLQKTLFFADRGNLPRWRFFTFKRWYLGQYSDDVAGTLNELQTAGRIRIHFDGPSGRLEAMLRTNIKKRIDEFFEDYFPQWTQAFEASFNEWAYLNNDQILRKAHDDSTYRQSNHGEIISESELAGSVDFEGLEQEVAESFADLVDARLQETLKRRFHLAAKRPVRGEDWRSIYFPEEAVADDAVS